VGREQRLAVLLEVVFIRIEHAIEPRQEFLRTMVGVQDDGDTVCRSNDSNVVGCRNRTGNRGLLLVVLDALISNI
jgi:hypothetical protein